jgi:tRNA dimethylallyltransferase
MKIFNKHIFVIFGPTAVGKTDTAFKIAEHIPSEIVNMDMGQLYTPLSIGTAKPDWRNEPVPHHMFDLINEPRNFSVTEYRTRLLQTLDDIWSRRKLPILVGGSGFYLKSIFFPPRIDVIKDLVDRHFENNKDLWQELYLIDPDRAAQLDRNDLFRIRRALNIWLNTNKKPSEFAPVFDPPASFTITCLVRDREELYKRINKRTRIMLKEGWIEEVQQLQGTEWESFIKEKGIIGYNDIFAYLESKQTKEDYKKMVSLIQKQTRHYAKRQLTFWRMLKRELVDASVQYYPSNEQPEIDQVNLTSTNLDLYIEELLKSLNKKIGE